MSTTVGEQILVELKRNRELSDMYNPCVNCGNSHGFEDHHKKINDDIDAAEKALAEQDIVEILKSYEALKGNQ